MFVIGELKNAKRNVARALLFRAVLMGEQSPMAIADAIKKRAGMTCIAKREPAAGREKGGDHRRGKAPALAGQRSELLVKQTDKFFLVEAIYKTAHEGAQIGGRRSYGFAMPGNIGEQQPANATGSATGNVVDVATTLGMFKRLAVYPHIETGQFDSTGRQLAASPYLHALHVLRGRIRHGSIITARAHGTDSSRLWKLFEKMARPGRLELPTLCLVSGTRSVLFVDASRCWNQREVARQDAR